MHCFNIFEIVTYVSWKCVYARASKRKHIFWPIMVWHILCSALLNYIKGWIFLVYFFFYPFFLYVIRFCLFIIRLQQLRFTFTAHRAYTIQYTKYKICIHLIWQIDSVAAPSFIQYIWILKVSASKKRLPFKYMYSILTFYFFLFMLLNTV